MYPIAEGQLGNILCDTGAHQEVLVGCAVAIISQTFLVCKQFPLFGDVFHVDVVGGLESCCYYDGNSNYRRMKINYS